MAYRRMLPVVLSLAALLSAGRANAAIITHNTPTDFAGGLSDGAAQVLSVRDLAAPNGAVGVVPGPGTALVNDDFNYTSKAAAEAAGWMLLTPNAELNPELVDNPSSFLFNDPAGTLRLHASRPQDLWNTVDQFGKQPVLALSNRAVTGDFVAETKFTFDPARIPDERRSTGIFLSLAGFASGNTVTDFYLDENSSYLAAGTQFFDGIVTFERLSAQQGGPVETATYSPGLTGDTWWVRVVKIGSYFQTYMKNSENGPWIFHQVVKIPALAGSQDVPLVVGVYHKSFGGTDAAHPRYQDILFDYFRLNSLGVTSGTFSNVMDAGQPAAWRVLSLSTQSMQGLKYQLRAGNTVSASTLTDAGPFVGPDGTGGTYFEDDAAQVIPNGSGKRYLEYKLFLDGLVAGPAGVPLGNLPAIVHEVSADYAPAALQSVIASNRAAFGADGGGLSTQPGDGDLSLTRTPLFTDEFTTALDAGWVLDPGYKIVDPSVVGEVNTTERPGYLRMKVGHPQDHFAGDNEIGGVRLLRDLPAGATDFEVETEVNLETMHSRAAGVVLWQDHNNYIYISVARRDLWVYEIGMLDELILGDTDRGVDVRAYGTDTAQLRIAKVGQVVTLSYRSPESPSWRVMRTLNMAGLATGGGNFAPTQAGLMGKSYGATDTSPQNYDFAYFKVSSLSQTGTKDVALTLPAGNRLDTLLSWGDAMNGANARFQLRNSAGTFVGPDNTAATFFTPNEPKVPDALSGQTAALVRVTLDATQTVGTPYLHALGLQYLTGDARVARDTNRADFLAGAVLNGIDANTTPGVIVPSIATGTPQTDPFSYSDNDLTSKGWAWSNTPSGNSSYSLTESAGNLRINMGWPEDMWENPANPDEKPRIAVYRTTPVTGDFDLETYVTNPNGRSLDRHFGLAVIQAKDGADANTRLDPRNLVMFGLFHPDLIHFMVADNNRFYDNIGPGGLTGNAYYLRIRKAGSTFTGYYKVNAGDPWIEAGSVTNPNITNAHVGFLGKSWGGEKPVQPADYDYFTYTPLVTTGTFESRVLDLGATGLASTLMVTGTNLAQVQFQFRAADTPGALASLPYLGPDGTAGSTYAGTYTGVLNSIVGKRYVQYRATLPPNTSLNDVALLATTATSIPFTRADALTALRIAGGLVSATTEQRTRLDVAAGTSSGKVDLLDAVAILKSLP